jgi:hypothetical protein
MSNAFTPLVTAPVSNGEKGIFALKVLPQAEVKAAFEPLPVSVKPEQPAKACATPTLTLQKQGDIVSGIRIVCGCGEVIELACSY